MVFILKVQFIFKTYYIFIVKKNQKTFTDGSRTKMIQNGHLVLSLLNDWHVTVWERCAAWPGPWLYHLSYLAAYTSSPLYSEQFWTITDICPLRYLAWQWLNKMQYKRISEILEKKSREPNLIKDLDNTLSCNKTCAWIYPKTSRKTQKLLKFSSIYLYVTVIGITEYFIKLVVKLYYTRICLV
jgi:hypothetical protein